MSTLLHVAPAALPHWARHATWFAFAAGVAFLVPFLGVSVLDLQHEVVVRRPDLQHAPPVRRVGERVHGQFLRDEPDVGEAVGVHPVHLAGVVDEDPRGPRTRRGPDDDELRVARNGTQRGVEGRGDRAGVGVGRAGPALAGRGEHRVRACGVREHGRGQLRRVVRALDVRGRRAEGWARGRGLRHNAGAARRRAAPAGSSS